MASHSARLSTEEVADGENDALLVAAEADQPQEPACASAPRAPPCPGSWSRFNHQSLDHEDAAPAASTFECACRTRASARPLSAIIARGMKAVNQRQVAAEAPWPPQLRCAQLAGLLRTHRSACGHRRGYRSETAPRHVGTRCRDSCAESRCAVRPSSERASHAHSHDRIAVTSAWSPAPALPTSATS